MCEVIQVHMWLNVCRSLKAQSLGAGTSPLHGPGSVANVLNGTLAPAQELEMPAQRYALDTLCRFLEQMAFPGQHRVGVEEGRMRADTGGETHGQASLGRVWDRTNQHRLDLNGRPRFGRTALSLSDWGQFCWHRSKESYWVGCNAMQDKGNLPSEKTLRITALCSHICALLGKTTSPISAPISVHCNL